MLVRLLGVMLLPGSRVFLNTLRFRAETGPGPCGGAAAQWATAGALLSAAFPVPLHGCLQSIGEDHP